MKFNPLKNLKISNNNFHKCPNISSLCSYFGPFSLCLSLPLHRVPLVRRLRPCQGSEQCIMGPPDPHHLSSAGLVFRELFILLADIKGGVYLSLFDAMSPLKWGLTHSGSQFLLCWFWPKVAEFKKKQTKKLLCNLCCDCCNFSKL